MSNFPKDVVLVHLGRRNKIPHMGICGWLMDNRRLLLTVRERGISVGGEGPLSGSHRHLRMVPSLGGRGRDSCGISRKSTNPVHEGTFLMTESPPKRVPPTNTTTFGGQISAYELGGGHTNVQTWYLCTGDTEESLGSLLGVGPLVFGFDHTEANATLHVVKPRALEDPRGVSAETQARAGSRAELCGPLAAVSALRSTEEEPVRGEVWWQETKDHHSHF